MVEPSFDLNIGALAPVADEVTVTSLDVTGQLPPELNGTLVRNGPNPFSGVAVGEDMLAWWVGPSMVHGIAVTEGDASWYRNRWVNTGHRRRYDKPALAADRMLDHNPNVNVIAHGGNLLALGEGGLPFVLNEQLDTVGPTTFGGALVHQGTPTGMMAHPKIDQSTGELMFFRADWAPPFLRYGVLDRDGNHVVDQIIDLPAPGMMHDCAITKSHTIFLDLNVGLDLAMLEHGAPLPIRWFDDTTTRIGIVPRHGGEPRWCDIDPCFIQHIVNAYDADDQTMVLDVVRYPHFLRFDQLKVAYERNPLGVLWRYTITHHQGSGHMRIDEHQLDDRFVELPRVDDRLVGHQHQFAYAIEQPTDREMRGIVKYDLVDNTQQRHFVPPGDNNSEPVFVPRQLDAKSGAEDDGWILTCVHRGSSDTTDVLVLDAGDIAAPPVATIHLPRRIPAGFHGAWITSS